jgi:hypothetical protein
VKFGTNDFNFANSAWALRAPTKEQAIQICQATMLEGAKDD